MPRKRKYFIFFAVDGTEESINLLLYVYRTKTPYYFGVEKMDSFNNIGDRRDTDEVEIASTMAAEKLNGDFQLKDKQDVIGKSVEELVCPNEDEQHKMENGLPPIGSAGDEKSANNNIIIENSSNDSVEWPSSESSSPSLENSDNIEYDEVPSGHVVAYVDKKNLYFQNCHRLAIAEKQNLRNLSMCSRCSGPLDEDVHFLDKVGYNCLNCANERHLEYKNKMNKN